jgi:hypothetical protein
MSLETTIYNVYEAKRYAEGISTVGKQTSVFIFNPNGLKKMLSPASLAYLDERYRALGPQPMPSEPLEAERLWEDVKEYQMPKSR